MSQACGVQSQEIGVMREDNTPLRASKLEVSLVGLARQARLTRGRDINAATPKPGLRPPPLRVRRDETVFPLGRPAARAGPFRCSFRCNVSTNSSSSRI